MRSLVIVPVHYGISHLPGFRYFTVCGTGTCCSAVLNHPKRKTDLMSTVTPDKKQRNTIL